MKYNSPWTIVAAVVATAGYCNRQAALVNLGVVSYEKPGRVLSEVPEMEEMLPDIVSVLTTLMEKEGKGR